MQISGSRQMQTPAQDHVGSQQQLRKMDGTGGGQQLRKGLNATAATAQTTSTSTLPLSADVTISTYA